MSAKRINALRSKLRANNLDGMIVTHLDHIRYLVGFTGSAGLLVIGTGHADFLTDFRYADQSAKQVKGARVSVVKGDLFASLKSFPKLKIKNSKYAFSSEHLTVAMREKLRKALPDTLFVPGDSILAVFL